MPALNIERLTAFGKRLATLRKKAGYMQTELATELGASQRKIPHYESQSEYSPAAPPRKIDKFRADSVNTLCR